MFPWRMAALLPPGTTVSPMFVSRTCRENTPLHTRLCRNKLEECSSIRRVIPSITRRQHSPVVFRRIRGERNSKQFRTGGIPGGWFWTSKSIQTKVKIPMAFKLLLTGYCLHQDPSAGREFPPGRGRLSSDPDQKEFRNGLQERKGEGGHD